MPMDLILFSLVRILNADVGFQVEFHVKDLQNLQYGMPLLNSLMILTMNLFLKLLHVHF